VSVFRFIATRKAEHSVKTLCRVLGVSRSGFHAWERRGRSDRELADAWLGERIREIHDQSRRTYGARRVRAALRHRGVRVGRKRVERLMRRERISGLVPKRFRRTTIRVPGVRVAGDLVERDFNPSGPNQLWVADISTCAAGKAGSTWPRSSTATAAASSAGRCAPTSRPSSSSTRSRWPSHDADLERDSCTTPIRARNTSR
jgi:transposase InsO family protein